MRTTSIPAFNNSLPWIGGVAAAAMVATATAFLLLHRRKRNLDKGQT
jgi:hypothetical protein